MTPFSLSPFRFQSAPLVTVWAFVFLLLPDFEVASQSQRESPTQRLVFAHYHMAHPSYSDTIEGYKQDIADAQALGIDGFVLNVGSWSREPLYQERVSKMFAAAERHATDFKLFLSADMCCRSLSPRDIQDMVIKYADRPNYFRYQDRPVLTTFLGQRQGKRFWQDRVLRPLRELAHQVLFVPFFATANGSSFDPTNATFNNPRYAQIRADYDTWWHTVVDGLSYWAVGGLTSDLVSSSEAYAELMRRAGKIYLAGTSPYFWEGRLNPRYEPRLLRRYYEYHGGEGIAQQWYSIIHVQKPSWVMILTFNDFTETYMTPAEPSLISERHHFYNVGPLIKSHAGYAELEKYFIHWYKTGTPPAAKKDALYYFYRTHPKNLTAPNDVQNIVQYGEVLDCLYVTTNLTQRATLRVSSGGVVSEHPLAAGLQHSRIPFHPGPQVFDVMRNGRVIIHKDGDPIDASIELYNFTTTSGFGYAE
jgi:glucan endo-1,3-alpha-glucosidase